MKTRLLYLLLFFLALSSDSKAQQAGMHYITNFAPDNYKAGPQNWAVVQDKRGVLFFGNYEGVLEYDGITWRLIKTSSTVRSLAMDSTGKIYVGIIGDFGYLQPDSLGNYHYKSLKEKIPLQDRSFNDIWKIFVSGNMIIFPSAEKIFILKNDGCKVIYPKESFHVSFLVNNTFYVRDIGVGLLKYENDSLRLVEGGKKFAKEKIYAMLPVNQNEILIATRTLGIWIYTPFKNIYKPAGFNDVDKFLLQHLVYCGTILMKGIFAIGTNTGGIIVFNQHGVIQSIYNTETGLQDNTILNMYSDNNQQLWVCTINGISLVQNNLPFRWFGEKNGLKGMPYFIEHYNNHLYVGTSQYLCIQNLDGNFKSIKGTEGQNWQLFQTKGTLLLANNNGIFEIREKQAFPIITSIGFYNLCSLKNKPNYLLAGSPSGLWLLEYNQKTWKIKNSIKGFARPAYKIVQDRQGSIWVYANPELYLLKLNAKMDSAIIAMHCTDKHGLPSNNNRPHRLNSGEVVFATGKGIYRYTFSTQTFEAYPDFSMLTGKILPFEQQKNGDIWFEEKTKTNGYEKGILKYKAGLYQLTKQPFYKFNDFAIDGLYNFHVYSDSIAFIGPVKGLLQYNSIQKVDYNRPFHTLIRNVFANDSLLFGGATSSLSNFNNIKGNVITYSQNDLVFHYAASFYEDVEKTVYSYRLIGSDTTWSAWVSDVKKEYTNLYEGEYTFEVRAKNQYKVIGSTATYSFRILPPWHRTWWAFSSYVVSFICLGFVIVKIYTRRLIVQKNYLEHVVKERTSEIVHQKEEIETQAKQLLTQNKKLVEMDLFKQGMTSMIVHDLKNPLNLLLNVPKTYEGDKKDNLIHQTGKQMLNMVMNILDVNKYEEVKMNLHLEQKQFALIIANALGQVQFLYEQKEIKIINEIDYTLVTKVEEEVIERVLVNLFTNAIKYTPRRGIITLSYDKITDDEVRINIIDTGEGIEEDKHHLVFQKFGQIVAKKSGTIKSTGLGLTFCKMAVEAHGGKIGLTSEVGKGTTFWFTLESGNYENIVLQKIKVREETKEEKLIFNEEEKKKLEPIIARLKEFTIYEEDDIEEIIAELKHSESENIQKWLSQLQNNIITLNQEKYLELLLIT